MKNKAIDARGYTFSNMDSVLIDSNVWLYLYGPASHSMWAATTYSTIFSRLLSAGSKLFLDVLVLSEFVNRFARLEMKRLQPAQNNFKVFRQSTDYQSVAHSIEAQVNQILSVCQPLDHDFSEWKLAELLKDFSAGSVDLNDQLIAENCRKYGFAVLTNDSDFTQGGISVLTANRKLLAACP